MSRAPYNTTAQLWVYPAGEVWTDTVGSPFECRLVVQERIAFLDGMLFDCEWWLTTDIPLPSIGAPWVPGQTIVSAFPSSTYGVAVPHDAEPAYVIVQVAYITPEDGPPYYRAYLRATEF